ncbi:MAG TPA: group 1 truncated hemoglobin [Pseudonocardiaceae bacterium]|jgi:hemoglobin|nr:group 1 truncated hemoglobin [Pseudonocardiaceae bacterium]
MSVLDRIGGAPALSTAAGRFYRRVLDDPELTSYFVGIDMPRLKRHQAHLLTSVLGGPVEYTGREPAGAHKGRGITEARYARVADHPGAMLHGPQVPDEVMDTVSTTVAGVREQIVAPTTGAGAR